MAKSKRKTKRSKKTALKNPPRIVLGPFKSRNGPYKIVFGPF